MSAGRNILFLCFSFFVFNVIQCAEFVPCLMWSNERTNEYIPALNKISQDVFENEINHFLEDGYLLVVFAEQTLSPEDFVKHDQSTETFPNLAKLKKSMKISYLPNVQNPIKALKHLDITVTEVPLDKVEKSFEIPDTDILTINLDDAMESENRIDMLKRHDAAIASIFEDLSKKSDKVVALYTAHHTSWVASEELVKSRQVRSLLETTETSVEPIPLYGNSTNFYKTSSIYLYVSEVSYAHNGSTNTTKFDYYIDTSNSSYYIFTAVNTTIDVKFEMAFTNALNYGYWEQVNLITAVVANTTYNLTSTAPIYALDNFSYHCGDQAFYAVGLAITLKDFQIQLFFDANNSTNQFSDAYDCVGFTTVPIWSGLFVTAILLIIMTIGITMMMDIRTMDRFDDVKGKTITINAE
jgi:V-type H+-transporting ATPase S1 subunit